MIWWVCIFLLPGDISLNPTDFGQISSTTLFLWTCTSSLSARALSNVDPSFSAIGLNVLQSVPFKKMKIERQAILNQSLTLVPGWMFSTVRGLFSSVSITKIGNSVSFLILNLEPHFLNTFYYYAADESFTSLWMLNLGLKLKSMSLPMLRSADCSSCLPPGRLRSFFFAGWSRPRLKSLLLLGIWNCKCMQVYSSVLPSTAGKTELMHTNGVLYVLKRAAQGNVSWPKQKAGLPPPVQALRTRRTVRRTHTPHPFSWRHTYAYALAPAGQSQAMWQCNWRHLVAKIDNIASGTTWWPN